MPSYTSVLNARKDNLVKEIEAYAKSLLEAGWKLKRPGFTAETSQINFHMDVGDWRCVCEHTDNEIRELMIDINGDVKVLVAVVGRGFKYQKFSMLPINCMLDLFAVLESVVYPSKEQTDEKPV